MKHKRLKLSAVLLVGFGLTSLQAQTMSVKETNGTVTSYALKNIRKMSFSGENITIQKTNNTTGVYVFSGLRYLNFAKLTTSIAEQPRNLGNAKLLAYPNPVADILNIDLTGLESEGIISILTLDGKVVLTHKTIMPGIVSINIGHLPQGIYFCRYSSAIEIKTVKFIKH